MDLINDDIVATALKHRDQELLSTLRPKDKVNVKTIDKKNEKKREFLAQQITLVITDSQGNVIPDCEFKVTRKYFRNVEDMSFLESLIRRCPQPDVEIDFFVDHEDGAVIWLEDMLLKALPPPSVYIIIPKIRRAPDDIKQNPCYTGETIILIKDIPNYCHDSTTAVDENTLKEWLLFAIIEEDSKLKKLTYNVATAKKQVDQYDLQLKSVSKVEFHEKNGTLMNDKKAEAERELLYKTTEFERMNAFETYRSLDYDLQTLIAERKLMRIECMKLINPISSSEVSSWLIQFDQANEYRELEDALMLKDDWPSIKLACGDPYRSIPPWVGRGRVPNGNKAGVHDYTKLEVDISGARIARVPHGLGTYKSLDNRHSSVIHTNEFTIYHGQWECGLKNGQGIEIDNAGIYSGRFLDNYRSGKGRLDYADGTTVTGYFQKVEVFPSTTNSEVFSNYSIQNPYLQGEPCSMNNSSTNNNNSGSYYGNNIYSNTNKNNVNNIYTADNNHYNNNNNQNNDNFVEILFGDGGMYKGEMSNGRINGYGEYQSPVGGEIFRGHFVNGILTDGSGYYKNQAGESYEGQFVDGDLYGEGAYKTTQGDEYKGHFYANFKHGRGCMKYKNLAEYNGYWCLDTFSGKGVLYFGHRDNNNQNQQQQQQSQQGNEQKTKISSGVNGVVDENDKKSGLKKRFNVNVNNNTHSSTSDNNKGSMRMNTSDKDTLFSSSVKSSSSSSSAAMASSQFKRCYMGYFLANGIMNGGYLYNTNIPIIDPPTINTADNQSSSSSNTTTTATSNNTRQQQPELPTIVSKISHKLTQLINSLLNKIEAKKKSNQRKIDKAIDMEKFLHKEIMMKKIQIFQQQKHHTKKSMYTESTYYDDDIRGKSINIDEENDNNDNEEEEEEVDQEDYFHDSYDDGTNDDTNNITTTNNNSRRTSRFSVANKKLTATAAYFQLPKTLKNEKNQLLTEELKERYSIRKNRLAVLDLDKLLNVEKPVIPGIKLIQINKPAVHLSQMYANIHGRGYKNNNSNSTNDNMTNATGNNNKSRKTYNTYNSTQNKSRPFTSNTQNSYQSVQSVVNYDKMDNSNEINKKKKNGDEDLTVKIAISDFEEMQERHRLIKYNKLIEMAEQSFIQYKRNNNH